MPTLPDIYQTGKLRRSTLVSLRWMAIAGQVLALAIVYLVLGFSVPIAACLVFIGLSALLNIMIVWRAPLDRRVSHSEAGVQLFFDVLQLAALLYLTGGLTNPFSILLLAPVVVGAKTLNIRVLAGLAGSVAGLSLLLMFYHLPLPWRANEILTLPGLYLYGAGQGRRSDGDAGPGDCAQAGHRQFHRAGHGAVPAQPSGSFQQLGGGQRKRHSGCAVVAGRWRR